MSGNPRPNQPLRVHHREITRQNPALPSNLEWLVSPAQNSHQISHHIVHTKITDKNPALRSHLECPVTPRPKQSSLACVNQRTITDQNPALTNRLECLVTPRPKQSAAKPTGRLRTGIQHSQAFAPRSLLLSLSSSLRFVLCRLQMLLWCRSFLFPLFCAVVIMQSGSLWVDLVVGFFWTCDYVMGLCFWAF